MASLEAVWMTEFTLPERSGDTDCVNSVLSARSRELRLHAASGEVDDDRGVVGGALALALLAVDPRALDAGGERRP